VRRKTTAVWAAFALTGMTSDFAVGAEERAESDWLVVAVKAPVRLEKHADRKEIVLTNGLVSRTFRTAPNFATIDYTNLMTGATVIRGVKPEAAIELDGQRLDGQIIFAKNEGLIIVQVGG